MKNCVIVWSGLELVGKSDTDHAAPTQTLQALMVDHPILLRYFNGGVVLLGPDGTVLADSTPLPGRVGNNLLDMDGVAAALHWGKPMLDCPLLIGAAICRNLALPCRCAMRRAHHGGHGWHHLLGRRQFFGRRHGPRLR